MKRLILKSIIVGFKNSSKDYDYWCWNYRIWNSRRLSGIAEPRLRYWNTCYLSA